MEDSPVLTAPVGLPTDTLCQQCNWSRRKLVHDSLTFDDGNAFQHVGDEFWACKRRGHLDAVKKAHRRKYGTAAARSGSAITQGSAITRASAAAMDDGIAHVRKSIDKMRRPRKSLSASAIATEARRNSATRLLLDATDKITQGNPEEELQLAKKIAQRRPETFGIASKASQMLGSGAQALAANRNKTSGATNKQRDVLQLLSMGIRTW